MGNEQSGNAYENFLGIGDTKATNTVDNIAQTAIKLSADSVTTCTVAASNEQLAEMHGATIGDGNVQEITQDMKSVMSMGCEQASNIDFDMQQAVINAVKQEAVVSGTDIGIGSNETNNVTRNITTLEAEIKMDTILESAMESAQTQQGQMSGITVGSQNKKIIRQNMSQKMFTDSLLKAIKSNSFVQAAANKIDQKGDAETKSTIVGVVSAIANIATSSMMWWAILFIAFILVTGYVLTSFLSGESDYTLLKKTVGGYYCSSTDYAGGKSEIMDYDYD
jgi:hypothetical protein